MARPSKPTDIRLLTKISRLYYEDGMGGGDIAEKLNMLIEAIGDSYPDKEISILDNSNQSMVYRKIGSAIEVEFIKSQTEFSDYDWYFLVFYLYESPHF